MFSYIRYLSFIGLTVAATQTSTALAADTILVTKLERTTNTHSLTLPKVSLTRVFDDGSSFLFEKSWYWQEGFNDSGWPSHDEAYINYALPSFKFGDAENWSLAPQIGAKFRSNVTRALLAMKVNYAGDGWNLGARYRYEQDTQNDVTEKSTAGRIDIYASYALNDTWTLLYNPHYHFKQEDDSPDYSTGDRAYLEQEFIAFYNIDSDNMLFGGYIMRAKNAEDMAVDPGQRYSSILFGYQHKF
ncbi:oligogalacturonate-specific porin KdgM family protein [Halomonas sp. V046]|uniref:oligogalacturonate-specific porin KdgM family protein n=1 Tax=Halomonas sp. V046 TaxID=3459611 RepID=UPI004044E8BA